LCTAARSESRTMSGLTATSPGAPLTAAEAEVAARHLELAAAAASVVRIEVMTLGADRAEAAQVDAVADQLCSATVGPAEPVGHGEPSARAAVNGAPGLVAVSPDMVRLSDLAAVHNMATLTGWPLLGVVVLRLPRWPWWRWHLPRRAAPSVPGAPAPLTASTAPTTQGRPG
jgi:hypothetical protein